MKALGIIGYHHTGKTSIVVALVKALTARGFRVATIKDIHSEKFRADIEGKNSALHIAAGSVQTFARGIYDSAMIYPKPLSLNEILPHIDADYLIIEGMKEAAVPKIVCAASATELDELIDDTCMGIAGVISDDLQEYRGLKAFHHSRDIDALCTLIVDKGFKILPMAEPDCCSRCGSDCYHMAGDIVQGRRNRKDCVLDSQAGISLEVGGRPITIVPFVQDILKDTILAVLKNLKDTDISKEIKIQIKP